MDTPLSPAKLFYSLALIVFSGMLLFPSPLLPAATFYCLIAGAIWSYVPQQMQIDYPRVREMAPPLFLLLFMSILTQVEKSTTETLFHTVRGLVMFRTLSFILIKVRISPHPISKPMAILITAILFEMVCVGIRVYHLIYPLDPMPGFLPYVEMKVLALTVAGLMFHAFLQKKRS